MAPAFGSRYIPRRRRINPALRHRALALLRWRVLDNSSPLTTPAANVEGGGGGGQNGERCRAAAVAAPKSGFVARTGTGKNPEGRSKHPYPGQKTPTLWWGRSGSKITRRAGPDDVGLGKGWRTKSRARVLARFCSGTAPVFTWRDRVKPQNPPVRVPGLPVLPRLRSNQQPTCPRGNEAASTPAPAPPRLVLLFAAGVVFLAAPACDDSPEWFSALPPAFYLTDGVLLIAMYALFTLGFGRENLGAWVSADEVILLLEAVMAGAASILILTSCDSKDSLHFVPAIGGLACVLLLVVDCALLYVMWRSRFGEQERQRPMAGAMPGDRPAMPRKSVFA